MRIINASFSIEGIVDGDIIVSNIERYGRICYKSEAKISIDSSKNFIKMIIKKGHESVLEHEKITVRLVCDRGVTHELVRHRIASYSQESTRYCNYYKDKFGKELTFIKPCFWNEDSIEYLEWKNTIQNIENCYMSLIKMGATPQEARSILPNSLKTEIIVTMNLREWRHFFKLRTSKEAHPQMREVACPLLDKFKSIIPVVFDDITY